MLIAAGEEDVRNIRGEYNLEDILKYYNCNVGKLSWKKFKRLLIIHFIGKTFVIKTHNRPTKTAEWLINQKIVKATYIYRDPRDVVLSALDHGKRIRGKGLNHTFASCSTIEGTIPKVTTWLDKNAMEWLRLTGVLLVKYEDLISDPVSQLTRLACFLELDETRIDFKRISTRYEGNNLDNNMKGHLHFNIGIPGRFRTVFNEEDLNICNQHFARYLEKMGYSL